MGKLQGKVAIITGGSRGIGRAIAERLAQDGATIMLTYLRNKALAEAVVAQIETQGGQARAMAVDLAQPADIERLFEMTEATWQRLDILVNSAAELQTGSIESFSIHDWQRVFAVNSTAPFLTIQQAARRLSAHGRIVNVSTINTVLAEPGIAAYAASKGSLEQLTRVAAWELADRGITVNSVSPGPTDTDLLRTGNPPEVLEQAIAMTPLGRLGQPKDIADVVAFLVGNDGRWITGQNLRVTGGLI
uniref:LtxD n=1 Tax=Lyngbya majuscula TaxID=158786 RepID=Q5V8A5_9CYAN|nr:LtxD [Lyngbya majuscula]